MKKYFQHFFFVFVLCMILASCTFQKTENPTIQPFYTSGATGVSIGSVNQQSAETRVQDIVKPTQNQIIAPVPNR